MTSRTQPLRGPITDYLIAQLTAELSPLLVGDAIAPPQGGWQGGDVGAGDFAAYVVLGTGPASQINQPAQTLRDQSGDEWNLAYTLTSYGGVRKQCDDLADMVRAAWQSIDLSRTVDLSQPWGFQSRQMTSYGSVDPQYVGTAVQWWSCRDSAVLRISAKKST